MIYLNIKLALLIFSFYQVINCYGAQINANFDHNNNVIRSRRQDDDGLLEMRTSGSSIVNDIDQYPYIASIYRKHVAGSVHRVLCTGTLVSETEILTTAKCVLTMPDFHNYMIHTGSPRSSVGGIRRNIVSLSIHPDYEKSKLDAMNLYNVALLTMDQPVTQDESHKIAKIPIGNYSIGRRLENLVENEAKCKAVGFGSYDLHKEDAGTLREVDMKLIPWNVCKNIYVGALEIAAQICVSSTESTTQHGYCFNDDGGVLTCEGVVYGIYSAPAVNKDCSKLPTTFIRLDSLSELFTTSNGTRVGNETEIYRKLPAVLTDTKIHPICQSLRIATANNPCPSECAIPSNPFQ